MKELMQAMTIAGQRAADETQKTRIGIVDSYDPNTFSVKVKLQPSGVLSGWIPIASCFVGNGWGLFAAPTIGDSVRIDAQEGDIDAGIMNGSLFNDVDRPLPVPSGEFWLQHKTGSVLKFLNNGDVSLHTARDLLVDTARDVKVTAARDVSVLATGNITAIAQGFAHLQAGTEVSIAGPIVNINAPIIGLNGNVTQTTGMGSAGVTMQGPVHVIDTIKSDTEVIAVTTPLHTHQHLNGGGTGNSGNPTP